MSGQERTVPTQAVHDSERAFFDRKTVEDLQWTTEKDWLVDPQDYKTTLALWGFQDGLHGKKVLDCGCGTGFFSVLLAKLGAEVSSFDISPKSVELTTHRANLNGVAERIQPKVLSFETLDYPDESFDLVVGKNILHHIPDITNAGLQIRRVLKKGGSARFYELSAGNPLLIFFRNHIIGKIRWIPKLGTPDEHPLTDDEIEALASIFDQRYRISYPKFRFFGKLDRQIFKQRVKFFSVVLEGMDRFIYRFFPPLRKYSYKIFLEFFK
jgi:ubiquinone/menaquinone biosynthesis C-methylase UbiE